MKIYTENDLLGLKFIHCREPDIIYTIDEILGDNVVYKWEYGGKHQSRFSIENTLNHLNNKIYLSIENTEQLIKTII